MQPLRIWASRIIGLLGRRRADAELDDELSSHLEMLVEENVRRGLSNDEAERAARRSFGGIDQTKEAYRQQRSLWILDTLAQDVRSGFRQLVKSPAFFAVAILTLTLGIGANTTVFSLIQALVLRSLPVREPQQLVRYYFIPDWPFPASYLRDLPLSGPIFQELRKQQSSCSDVFAWGRYDGLTLAENGEVRPVRGAIVSGTALRTLGVNAALGRLIDDSDDRFGEGQGDGPAGWSADISYGFWQNHFRGDSSVIGQSMIVNQTVVNIAGVLPRNFQGVLVGEDPELILPMQVDVAFRGPARSIVRDPGYLTLTAIGRLKPGVTLDQAGANLDLIRESILDEAVPKELKEDNFGGFRFRVTSAASGWSDYRRQYEKPLLIVQALVIVVLFLICANLAGLLLARAGSRKHELEIRRALGASRLRLVRQLLTESALLGVIGVLIGCLLAWRAGMLVAALLVFPGLQLNLDLRPDLAVIGIAAASGLLTVIGAGTVPALMVTSTAAGTLQAGRRQSAAGRGGGLGKWLITLQVALSLVLVTTASLCVGSIVRMLSGSTGMPEQGVFVAPLSFEQRHDDPEQLSDLYSRMLVHLGNQPEVESATLSRDGLMQYAVTDDFIAREEPGFVREDKQLFFNSIGPGFFDTLGIGLLRGRDFARTDTCHSARICILNQSAARYFFPTASPLGRHMEAAAKPGQAEGLSYEVVGVVGDAKYNTLHEDPPPTLYLPFSQDPNLTDTVGMSFLLRGPDRDSLTSAYRNTLKEFAVDTPISNLIGLRQKMLESIDTDKMIASLAGFLGITALLLTCVSLYGQIAWKVTERTAEIGIRVALGATRRNVSLMVLSDLVFPVAIGMAFGLAGAIGLSTMVVSLLYNARPTDPLTLLLSVGSMTAAAAIAAYIPARRAASIDPMECLRTQ
jgi:predicted permease